MQDEWETVTVQDLVDWGVIERPMDGNHGEIHPKVSDFVDSGIPFIMASDLIHGKVDVAHCAFISEVHARTLRKGFSYPGDVLISHKATMGRTALVQPLSVPFVMLTPQVTYYRVRDAARLSNRYLKFYFDSPKFQKLFETWGQKGSTRSYIGITDQLNLPIELPPPNDQRAIAHILGALDDKIELNRRMNETLEAMARAIFKDWFIDFGPTRAKLANRAITLPESVANLFPTKLTADGIPEGWRCFMLSEIALQSREALLPTGNPEQIFEHYSLPAYDSGQSAVLERGEFILSQKTIVAEGAVLLSKLNPEISRVWVPDTQSAAQQIASTEFLVFVPTAPVGRSLLFCLFKDQHFKNRLEGMVTGTSKSHQRISSTSLSGMLVLYGSESVFKRFEQIVAPLIERTIAARRETRELAALRNTLLPKLISGEIRVKEAQKIAEAAR